MYRAGRVQPLLDIIRNFFTLFQYLLISLLISFYFMRSIHKNSTILLVYLVVIYVIILTTNLFDGYFWVLCLKLLFNYKQWRKTLRKDNNGLLKDAQECGKNSQNTVLHVDEIDFFSQKQPSVVFFKKGVLKTFAKFTGKQLCRSLLFSKIASIKKETSTQKFSLWILWNFQENV